MILRIRFHTLRSVFNLIVRANCCAPSGSAFPSETSAFAFVTTCDAPVTKAAQETIMIRRDEVDTNKLLSISLISEALDDSNVCSCAANKNECSLRKVAISGLANGENALQIDVAPDNSSQIFANRNIRLVSLQRSIAVMILRSYLFRRCCWFMVRQLSQDKSGLSRSSLTKNETWVRQFDFYTFNSSSRRYTRSIKLSVFDFHQDECDFKMMSSH